MTASNPPADRYGRRRSPVLTIGVTAAVLLGAFGTWLAWVFATDPAGGLDWNATAAKFNGNSAHITFTVSAPPGTKVSCAIRTLGSNMATNGWVIRDFPAASVQSTDYVIDVRSVTTPTSADVYRCWKTGS
jgi:hypothetical protein